MKEIATTLVRNLGRVFGSVMLFAFATAGTAFADNISKTFEFGAGLAQTRSNVRTFNLPCGTEGGVAAVVKFQRLGPVGASNNIPIIIELREPDTAPDQEGPIVETKTATAKTTEQTIILSSQSNNRGCSLPWRVRVKYADEGTAPFRTFGSIRLDFDGRLKKISVQTYAYGQYLNKGSSKEYRLGNILGLGQGIIEITANWRHIIGTDLVTGANPVKLKWQLIDPNGAVVKTVEAYSSNEARSELTRFKLLYQVTKCVAGQWKLKITNNTNDDAFVDETKAESLPGCPN